MKKEILEKFNNLTLFDKDEIFPEVITFTEVQNSTFIYAKDNLPIEGKFDLENLITELLKKEQGKTIIKKALQNIII